MAIRPFRSGSMTRPAGEPVSEATPRVSVIIATFNRAEMLRCAIQSVLAQELADIEVLVIGDRCTDDSEEVVAQFNDPRVHWRNRTENCGSQWGPNNDGIAIARAPYIAFLGHDDLWFPWHLTTLLPLVDAGADLAHPMVGILSPDRFVGIVSGPLEGETYATSSVPPSGWLVRKSVLQVLGGFRDRRQLTKGTDDDLLARMHRAGYRFVAAPRLSVLKFPSHFWRAYAADAAVPQKQWLASIDADAREVERDVLTQAAPGMRSVSATGAFFRAVRRLMRRFLQDNGLLAPLLRARQRRQVATFRKRRGL
jgi:glycosyltransferase involved in cell wall biosynthesis